MIFTRISATRVSRKFFPAVCLAMVIGALAAPVAASGTYPACQECDSRGVAWTDGEFDQVHLVDTHAGTLHPQRLAPEPLAKILATLRYKTASGAQAVLDAEGAGRLARGLATGLGKASAQQEAVFLVTTGDAKNLFSVRHGSSGRAFVDRNGLNLIFAEVMVDFVGQYRGTKRVRPFHFGSRGSASPVALTGANLQQQRADWVVVPLDALRDHQAAASMPLARDEQYYAAQEARLKALKRLRDQNLIDEQEYHTKRGEILMAW